ncbi:hypothetical protein K470DRAFT_269008 [Piedraia hortae CBS 480.64]|uniref:Uncharacterized protein n=1 Tax=Piedraia hortae CBS 480.64 TaxID=1314780 RepID=A0A6A7C532_9PEZI|nr:hypothetical protein K470DRAFT_269008 [Piedraia hortae CBS 480.64]
MEGSMRTGCPACHAAGKSDGLANKPDRYGDHIITQKREKVMRGLHIKNFALWSRIKAFERRNGPEAAVVKSLAKRERKKEAISAKLRTAQMQAQPNQRTNVLHHEDAPMAFDYSCPDAASLERDDDEEVNPAGGVFFAATFGIVPQQKVPESGSDDDDEVSVDDLEAELDIGEGEAVEDKSTSRFFILPRPYMETTAESPLFRSNRKKMLSDLHFSTIPNCSDRALVDWSAQRPELGGRRDRRKSTTGTGQMQMDRSQYQCLYDSVNDYISL